MTMNFDTEKFLPLFRKQIESPHRKAITDFNAQIMRSILDSGLLPRSTLIDAGMPVQFGADEYEKGNSKICKGVLIRTMPTDQGGDIESIIVNAQAEKDRPRRELQVPKYWTSWREGFGSRVQDIVDGLTAGGVERGPLYIAAERATLNIGDEATTLGLEVIEDRLMSSAVVMVSLPEKYSDVHASYRPAEEFQDSEDVWSLQRVPPEMFLKIFVPAEIGAQLERSGHFKKELNSGLIKVINLPTIEGIYLRSEGREHDEMIDLLVPDWRPAIRAAVEDCLLSSCRPRTLGLHGVRLRCASD